MTDDLERLPDESDQEYHDRQRLALEHAEAQQQVEAEQAANPGEPVAPQTYDVPDQTPPEGFEPQVEQVPQDPGVYEQPGGLVDDVEAEPMAAAAQAESGAADDGDDDVTDPLDSDE